MKSILKGLIAISLLLSFTLATAQSASLKPIVDNYFLLKDALVKSNSKSTSVSAEQILTSVKDVDMPSLTAEEHTVWMKIVDALTNDAKAIAATQDLKKQRESFKSLSQNIYAVLKVSHLEQPIYYNHCPMLDVNWLSTEKGIKNPYYGAHMLTCGKTIETLK